jgi:hypothetical protein
VFQSYCEDVKTLIFTKLTNKEVRVFAHMEKDYLYTTIQLLAQMEKDDLYTTIQEAQNRVKSSLEVKRMFFDFLCFFVAVFLTFLPT